MNDYLSMLVGRETKGFIEVRAFPHGKPRQKWFTPDAIPAAAHFIASQAAKGDVFVGVAPRTRQAGGKSAVDHSWVLWVDVDADDWEQRLSRAPVAPSYVVASGSGGCHAYWALSKPAPAVIVESANRRLAYRIGGDMNCTDSARILRPPQTFNWKTGEPRPVLKAGGHGRLVSLLLVADLPEPPDAKPMAVRQHKRTHHASDPLLGVASSEYVPLLTGREPNGRGMVKCPFHAGGQERTPSLKVWNDPARGFMCYGCRTGGDIYAFASRLWEMESRGESFVRLKERLQEVVR